MNASALPDHRDHDRMQHFVLLSQADQQDAIRRLAAEGLGDHQLAAATQLSVEAVRRVLGEHRASTQV